MPPTKEAPPWLSREEIDALTATRLIPGDGGAAHIRNVEAQLQDPLGFPLKVWRTPEGAIDGVSEAAILLAQLPRLCTMACAYLDLCERIEKAIEYAEREHTQTVTVALLCALLPPPEQEAAQTCTYFEPRRCSCGVPDDMAARGHEAGCASRDGVCSFCGLPHPGAGGRTS